MTFAFAMWYARGQIDAMHGLSALSPLDAEQFGSYVLNLFGVNTPNHETVRALWEAWSDTRIAQIQLEGRTN